MRPTIEEITAFFDEVDETYLTPFDWKPNLSQGRTFRLKDRFRVRYKDMICIYDDVEDCRVMFHAIFRDNLKYVYQCQDIIEKIKKITNPENYQAINENKNSGLSTNKSSGEEGSYSSGLTYVDEKDGSISGSGEATTTGKQYNTKFKAIETKGVLDKNDDAIMQIIDPNARSISQTYKRNKNYGGNMNQSQNTMNTLGMSGFKNESTSISKVIASNEIRALAVNIPRLTAEFLECFNALFYY